MEHKVGTEIIRLAFWARVLIFVHNVLEINEVYPMHVCSRMT